MSQQSAGSDKKLRKVIITELEDVRKKYGDERRTQIIDESAEIQLEDLIAEDAIAHRSPDRERRLAVLYSFEPDDTEYSDKELCSSISGAG